jgi:gas vesicle protein
MFHKWLNRRIQVVVDKAVKDDLKTELEEVKDDLKTELEEVKEDLERELEEVKEDLEEQLQVALERIAVLEADHVDGIWAQATRERLDRLEAAAK